MQKLLVSLILLTTAGLRLFGQDPSMEPRGNAYMDRQAQALLTEIGENLAKYKPQKPEPAERRLSLLLLDAVLHDVYAASRPPVQAFFHSRIEKAVNEIEQTKVDKGARIWKLYNMGFIVKTRTTTFAFDLISGANTHVEGFALPDSIMVRLVRQCDALFISHRHPDHADEAVAQLFTDAGKPVVAPPQVWIDKPIYPLITHLKRETGAVRDLPVQNGKQILKVIIYPGHQMEKTENNVSLVRTPEGLSFCHMGDQINEGAFVPDYSWIDSVGFQQKVDVLIPPCWTNELFRIVKGFNPRLVLPGHENELGHRVDDRVPFWGDAAFLQLTYPELKQSDFKVLNMTWGESILYTR